MRQEARNQILWLGAAPAKEWLLAAEELAFELRPVASIPEDEALSRCRCIAVSVAVWDPPSLRHTLKASFPAMEAGAAVFVVSPGAEPSLRTQLTIYLDDFIQEHRLFGEFPPLSYLTLDSASPLPLFRRCIAHDPGPYSARSPIIKGDSAVDAEDFRLLQRTFGKYHRIHLARQGGGRSTAGAVWRVTATNDAGHESVPYIVKCAPRAVIEQEHRGCEAFVRPYVDFTHQPARIKGGWVRGRSRAALAATLVPGAEQLDAHLLKGGDPVAAIAQLTNSMHRWRRHRTLNLMSPGQRYVDELEVAEKRRQSGFQGQTCEVLPKLDELTMTFEACKERMYVESPKQIWKRLRSQPKDAYPWCIGHGDLNCRNVMVRPNGEVVLLDFTHCDQMLASRDLARLEVNLALDVANASTPFLSDKQLIELYLFPLLGREESAAADFRLRAINELRKVAVEEGLKEGEYATSLACHLLRYSRHRAGAGSTATALGRPEEETRLRMIAYHVASTLISLHCGDSSEEGPT